MNPFQPTSDEITQWAYSGTAWPDSDWDHSIISSEANDEVMLRLASDRNCPHQFHFLHMLYYLAGELWDGGSITQSGIARLRKLCLKGGSHLPMEVRHWAARVDALLSAQIEFDNQLWLHFIVSGQEEFKTEQENE